MVRRTEQGALSNESNLISGFISIRSGAYFSSCNRSDFEQCCFRCSQWIDPKPCAFYGAQMWVLAQTFILDYR